MTNNKLSVMVGIPGSGKSTFAKKVHRDFPKAVYLESDAIREELFNGKQGKEETKKVFDEMFKRTIGSLKEGKDVIYDATNVSYKDRRRLLNSIPKGVHKCCYVVITPIDVCKGRNSDRDNPVPNEAIDQMVKRFNYPLKSEGFDFIGTVDSNTEIRKIMNKSVGFHGEVKLEDLMEFIKGKESIPAWKDLSDNQLAMKMFKALAKVTPEFHTIRGLAQDNPNHTFSVSMHMFHAWKDVLRQRDEYEGTEGYESVEWDSLAVSALFHDIGKGLTKEFKNAKGEPTKFAHYYNHENVSAYLTNVFAMSMANLIDEDVINVKKVSTLVQFHMKLYPYAQSEKQWKKLIDDETTFLELEILNEADKSAK